jgi:SAM-dependent methyltransferase
MELHTRIENLIHALRYRQVVPYVCRCLKLVDLGCGRDYRFLRKVKDQAVQCWGFDLVAPDRTEDNLTLKSRDITQPLPFADGEIDQISVLAVIEHLENPERVFGECQRTLRPGGRLIVTTPSKFGIGFHEILRKLRLVQDVEPEEHKDFGMSKELLGDWARKSGLEVETLRSFEMGINLLLIARKPSTIER